MKVCQPYLEQKDSSKTKQFLQGAWQRRGVSLYFGERGKRNKQEGTIIENRMKTEKGSHFSFPPPRSLVKQPPREKPSSFEGHFASRLILAWNRPF